MYALYFQLTIYCISIYIRFNELNNGYYAAISQFLPTTKKKNLTVSNSPHVPFVIHSKRIEFEYIFQAQVFFIQGLYNMM